MTYLAQNLESLARRNPDLAARVAAASSGGLKAESARSGALTVRRDGAWLHSPYDPVKEATQWAETSAASLTRAPVTVLGFGLGHHLQALAAAGFSGTVIEDDLSLFRLALETSDLSSVLERFHPLIGIPDDTLHRRHRNLLLGQVIAHPASTRTGTQLGLLKGYAEALPLVRQGGMKILVVNPIYGGSLPTARHCASALRRMGHVVEVFQSEMFEKGMEFADTFEFNGNKRRTLAAMANYLSQCIEVKAKETRPDLILALAQAPLSPETLAKFDKIGVPTAFWFVEDYMVLPYWREMAPCYSLFFGIQREPFVSELERIGVTRFSYLPTCAAADVHLPLALSPEEREEFGSDLSFVGAGYPNRQILFRALLDYRFKIWGSDWPLEMPLLPFIQREAARIDSATCVKIFNAAKINLNLHSSISHGGVDPDGDFVNPRTFEVASCGAFQVVDRRKLMHELFDEGELATFGSLPEMREKIDFFLAHEKERREVTLRGQARVLAEHTYDLRMEELLCVAVSHFPHLLGKRSRRIERRQEVCAEIERHPGLREMIETGNPEWRKLTDVIKTIPIGKRQLTRAEKIFLMLGCVETIREEVPE